MSEILHDQWLLNLGRQQAEKGKGWVQFPRGTIIIILLNK